MLATLLPSGALSILPASTQPLATVTLPKYRELLRKLKSHGSVEESSSSFQQAKERVLLRLQQRRYTVDCVGCCMQGVECRDDAPQGSHRVLQLVPKGTLRLGENSRVTVCLLVYRCQLGSWLNRHKPQCPILCSQGAGSGGSKWCLPALEGARCAGPAQPSSAEE